MDNLSEPDAFELERHLISEIGRDNLVNMTDGGEGSSGKKMSDRQRQEASKRLKGVVPVEAVAASIFSNSKPISTVCGMRFPSSRSAALWLNENGFPTACASGIISSLKGISSKAYGYSWVYQNKDGTLLDSAYKKSDYDPRKPVGTACGLRFDSAKSAADWLRENGYPRAQLANISSNCKGRVNKAHGFRWGYVKDGEIEFAPINRSKKIIPVCNSMGLVFYGRKAASEYMERNFGIKTYASGITACILGSVKHVSGVRWAIYEGD